MPSWRRRPRPGGLLGVVAAALPGHQHAAGRQQRRRVLGQHGQRGHRPRGDRRRRRPRPRPPRAPRPGCAARGRWRARPARPGGRSPRTCGPADSTRSTRAPGQRHGQREAGEARAGAEVGDRGGAGQGLGHSSPDRLSARCTSSAPGRDRSRWCAGRPRPPVPRAAARAAPPARRPARGGRARAATVSRETVRGPATGRSGETTSRRSGSSPSLWVSMSVRSAR